jgi:hypothetical protein
VGTRRKMFQILNQQAQVRLAVNHVLVAFFHPPHGFLTTQNEGDSGRGGGRKGIHDKHGLKHDSKARTVVERGPCPRASRSIGYLTNLCRYRSPCVNSSAAISWHEYRYGRRHNTDVRWRGSRIRGDPLGTPASSQTYTAYLVETSF